SRRTSRAPTRWSATSSAASATTRWWAACTSSEGGSTDMSNTTYRTCPRSGLQFERNAETLMKVNAFVAVVWLLFGGVLAIGVVLTRWPAIHWLPAEQFYMVLTAHGIDMLIFWIIFFEVAVLYFASST